MMMRKSIRCCISCILPCGALDVIRIVHSNGRVEEISGATIKASEIMKAHPKHVLKKPSSPSAAAPLPNIVVVPPDALLQRGKIYFLMPLPSPPPADKNHNRRRTSSTKKKARKEESKSTTATATATTTNNNNSSSVVVSCDRYLTEIMSEKISTQRDRRRGRVAVWRPHLESISESSSSSSPPSTTTQL